MSLSPQSWQIHLALGACLAGRWLVGASLALALFALLALSGHFFPSSDVARILWSGVVLALVPTLYLGVRLELDRHLFAQLARTQTHAESSEVLAGLDQALADLGWKTTEETARPLLVRVNGVSRLARRLGVLILIQIITALAAALIG